MQTIFHSWQSIVSKALIVVGSICCVAGILSAPFALLSGILISVSLGNPWSSFSKKLSPKLLSYSLVAVGAGMSLFEVARVGLSGFGYTLVTISGTLLLGLVLMKFLKSEYESSILVTAGTAICGGSAIAAVSPAIHAKSSSMSIALGVVFLLNACALFIFPVIGHGLGFSEQQFGIWSALAIHDTSAVIGSALSYGPKALEVGVTIKLARALWIVPLTLCVSFFHRRKSAENKENLPTKFPLFILGFFLCAAFFTLATLRFPELEPIRKTVELLGKKGLILTLFLIGLNINLRSLKEVGIKPVVLGLLLWILVSLTTGFAVYCNWIKAA